MAEILRAYETQVESFTLIPSAGGRFEFSVNGALLYSKLQTARHAKPGEVADLVQKYIQEKRV
ncbi:MAG: Rdx family protein [Anaerolineales bacterium]|nr:Rdx family protein [Anaerolineales bacterium]